jgi:hypothetical protein
MMLRVLQIGALLLILTLACANAQALHNNVENVTGPGQSEPVAETVRTSE